MTLERKLLAHLVTPEAITEAWDAGVRAEQFEEPLNMAVWNFTVNYWQSAQRQSAPTPWVLGQEFSGYTLADTEEELGYLASLLKRRYLSNTLQDTLRRAAADSMADPETAAKNLLADAFTACEIAAPRLTRLNMAETIDEFWADYTRGEDSPQGTGVPYGLDLLDAHTGGILPGELAVIGGFAKTGKTMFGLHAVAQAVRRGYRPLVFTLEMGPWEIWKRLAAMYTGVSYDRISHRRCSEDEKDRLRQGLEELRTQHGVQIECPEQGDRTVGALISRARQYGTDYLFIDQLSKMEAGHKTFTRKEEYASILRQLNIAISRAGSEIPCLLAVQLRREEGEPTIQSFADAAEVERDCDLALVLWRTRDLRSNGQMKLDIVAARRCDTLTLLLEWQLRNYTRIRTLEEVNG
jgi:replicative DNA helicase